MENMPTTVLILHSLVLGQIRVATVPFPETKFYRFEQPIFGATPTPVSG